MSLVNKKISLVRTLVILTVLFVIAQIVFSVLTNYVIGLYEIVGYAVSPHLFFSRIVFIPVMQFLLAQVVVYFFFLYFIWFIAISVGDLLSLRERQIYYLGLFCWVSSVIAIMLLNVYFVSYSQFTFVLDYVFSNDILSRVLVRNILIIFAAFGLCLAAMVVINMSISLYYRRHFLRNGLMLALMIVVLACIGGRLLQADHKFVAASAEKPNIILIGFDALRPDHLSFFDRTHVATPNFDAFLRSATVFAHAYTPEARTFPSWSGILTGRYPLHNSVRENNFKFDAANLGETLPKILQASGYETIYATDDRRFNLVDKRYGFNRVIGPPGTVADYLIGTLNDFPLTNLLAPTFIGRILFPYNHANRSSSNTYDPDNFLQILMDGLPERSDKPLFLAVHFDLSGWPFYWFNDGLNSTASTTDLYRNAVKADDVLLANFLNSLQQRHILDHAIVVLLSDHGVGLGLHGDRAITEKKFLGNKLNMKVRRYLYADIEKVTFDPGQIKKIKNNQVMIHLGANTNSIFDIKNYGVDTSLGYGGDLLSQKQHQVVLAIKMYGLNAAAPHVVSEPTLLLDIKPTLLDALHLPVSKQNDAMSLLPYLLNSHFVGLKNRTLYFESAYSMAEIEQRDIAAAKVAKKSLRYFMINTVTGTVMLSPSIIPLFIKNKQRAILRGDWLLVFYPSSERFQLHEKNHQISFSLIDLPPYMVLVNLKTGEWTTEMNHAFALASPLHSLEKSINAFYGSEMKVYKR